jgi:hypothetical protein
LASLLISLSSLVSTYSSRRRLACRGPATPPSDGRSSWPPPVLRTADGALSLSLSRPPADPLFSALCCSDDPDLVPDDVEIVKPGWVVPHEEGRGKEVLHWLVYVTHLPSSLVTTHQRCTARTCNALLTDSICCARAGQLQDQHSRQRHLAGPGAVRLPPAHAQEARRYSHIHSLASDHCLVLSW